MTDQVRAGLHARFEELSTQGFRLLGIAGRAELADQATCVLEDEAELTFAGFAIFLDPPKASAGAALKNAGCGRRSREDPDREQ